MNMEPNAVPTVEVEPTVTFKTKNADGSPRVVSAYMPTVDEIVTGLQGDGPLAHHALAVFKAGWVGIIRNDIAPNKDGSVRYAIPKTIEDFIFNQVAKMTSKANRGEGLRIRRASLEEFCLYLLSQGVVAGGIKLIRGALKDNDTLTARVDIHDRMKARLELWAETLDDAGMVRNQNFLTGCLKAMETSIPEDAYGSF